MLTLLFDKRASIENPTTKLSDPDLWLYDALGGGPTAAGMRVNERTAMQLTAVASCIKILSESIAQLPLNLYRRTGERRKAIARDHATHQLLHHQVNSWMTAYTWKEMTVRHAAGWGNAYSMIIWSARGHPVELLPLMPWLTKPEWRDEQLFYRTTIGSQGVLLSARDVLHIRAHTNDGVTGISPIREQAEFLGYSLATQDFSARFYSVGGAIRGYLSTAGVVRDPDKLREAWQKQFGGNPNAFKTPVLENGLKYERLGIPQNEAQFIETRGMQRAEIASIYRIPPHMINEMGRATWNNVEAMGTNFVVYTLAPWFTRIEQELEAKLLDPEERQGYFTRFKAQGLMRADHAGRSAFYRGGIQSGWLTRNEVREFEDLDPIEGLDDPLVPLNMGTTDDLEKPDDGDPKPPDPTIEEDKRAQRILHQAAERCVRRELSALGRMLEEGDYRQLSERLEAFYDDHAAFIAQCLAVPFERAQEYGRARWRDVLSSPGFDAAMTSEHDLIEQTLELARAD